MNRMRRNLAARLTDALAEFPDLIAPVERPENKHVYQMYTVRVKGGLNRDEFVRSLNKRGVGASIHFFPPVHHMPPYSGLEYRRDDLSVTEEVIREIVTLPMYPQMSAEDLAYMVEAIADSLSELR